MRIEKCKLQNRGASAWQFAFFIFHFSFFNCQNKRTVPQRPIVVGALLFSPLVWMSAAHAYVEIPYTLGRLVTESTHVMLVQVDKVDKTKNLIIYRKIK